MSGQLQRVVGENLRLQRTRLGLTQEQFTHVVGNGSGYSASLERGERDISLRALEDLARCLDLDPLDLLRHDKAHRQPGRHEHSPRPGDNTAAGFRRPTTEVLRFITDSPGHSRVELCELLPFPASTLRRAVRDLINAGLIEEESSGIRRSKAGRRPRTLRIATQPAPTDPSVSAENAIRRPVRLTRR